MCPGRKGFHLLAFLGEGIGYEFTLARGRIGTVPLPTPGVSLQLPPLTLPLSLDDSVFFCFVFSVSFLAFLKYSLVYVSTLIVDGGGQTE